jgi:hypothetical protein
MKSVATACMEVPNKRFPLQLLTHLIQISIKVIGGNLLINCINKTFHVSVFIEGPPC